MGKLSDSPHFLIKDYFDITKEANEGIQHDDILYQWLYPFVSIIHDDDIIGNIVDINQTNYGINNDQIGMVFTEWIQSQWNIDYSYSPSAISTDGSYLVGPKTNIIVAGGSLTELFVKDDDYGFYPINVRYIKTDENQFKFYNHGISDYYPGTTITESLSGCCYLFNEWDKTPKYPYNSVDNGSEIYFRKDSFYHEWLNNRAHDHYINSIDEDFTIREYVNTDTTFSFFGNFYKTIHDTKCSIIYDGMKDFSMRAIPEHQRTEGFVNFTNEFFDKVYQQHFNLLKNIYTMIDPMEIDPKYLGYLSKYYNMFDITLRSDLEVREYILHLVSMLKRKGTYSEFYILWRILTTTINRLNVYEKWHDSTITGAVSGSDWEEYIYLNKPEYQYTQPTDGAGQGWYLPLYATDIPGYDTSGKVLSTHYRLELDINIEPLLNYEILNEEMWNTLFKYFEYLRPINRVSDYRILFSPRSNFSGFEYSLYDSTKYAYCGSTSTDFLLFEMGAIIHTQIELSSDIWHINHNLNTKNIMIQVIDENFDVISPGDIYYDDYNNLTITYPVPVKGYALLRKADTGVTRYPPTVWTINHLREQKEVIVHYRNDDFFVHSSNTKLIDDDNSEAEIGYDITTAMVSKGHYIFTQPTPATEWLIISSELKKGTIMAVYGNDDVQVEPSLYDIQYTGVIEITFREPFAGYVIFYNVGNLNFDDIMEDFEESIDPVSYWKISNEEGVLYLPDPGEVVDPISPEGMILDVGEVDRMYSDDDYYYFDIELQEQDTYSIREIALYDKYERQIFHTRCSELFKPENIDMTIHYRVRKTLENI